ncbi:MAG: undecaprenyl-diphosphate phosphatase [Agathobacter sp.]|nr:undecaprenyl-diphosphate phosphatase [Agathobacter sp.]
METIFEILKALLFGIVEGITEWLPVSSTGHMILLNEFVKLDVSKEFWSMFLVVIQLGAILAVVLIFWNTIWPFAMAKHTDRLENLGRRGFWQQKYWYIGPIAVKMEIIINWLKIVVACLPAILFVLLDLDDICDALFYNAVGVSIALIVFGIAFIVVETRNTGRYADVKEMSDITWKMAALIGVFQLLAAAFPGTSRSGATIIGALLIGISRKAASEFTFILAIPVMLGASLLELLDFGFVLSGTEVIILLTGMVSAFLVSIFVIKFLLSYIRKHDFKVFGWYRIALGIVVLLCGFMGII